MFGVELEQGPTDLAQVTFMDCDSLTYPQEGYLVSRV